MSIDDKFTVHVDFFGGMRIKNCRGTIDESDINSSGILKLIAYLVLNRNSVISSDILTAVIWPHGVENPYGSLRSLVFRTKTLLKPLFPDNPLIKASRGSYAVNPIFSITDDTKLLGDRINEAAAKKNNLYPVDDDVLAFLDSHMGLFLPSLASDAWGLPVGTYYNTRLLSYVNTIVGCLLKEKRYCEAIAYASKGLAIDPLSEPLHEKIIISLVSSGNRKNAADYLSNVVLVFKNEYGIKPSDSFLKIKRYIVDPESVFVSVTVNN